VVAGKYRLREQIGEGAMGTVWAAVHEALDRQVAIKFLVPSQEDRDTAAARFVREAKSAARLKHRFVVDVFDFGVTDDGYYFMVQELLEGQELASTMRLPERWKVHDAVQFLTRCLSGLDAVHRAGLVHRDLKPENIFVVRDNDGCFPKLLDFGISKVLASEPGRPVGEATGPRPRMKQLTRVGVTLGTPVYMSPEQLRGLPDLDGRSDLYSVGVLLYQWLTGHLPYASTNLVELVLQIDARSAPTLAELRPELGHALSQALVRSLEPKREDRFADAQAMREALVSALASVPGSALCASVSGQLRAAPAKTEVMLAPLSSPVSEHVATLRRLVPRALRTVRAVPLAWRLAIATCFALLVLAFSLLREARPGIASAAEEGRKENNLVIGAPPPAPSVAPSAPVVQPIVSAPSEDQEPVKPARRPRAKKRGRAKPAAGQGSTDYGWPSTP
jgi:serine/threonine-protein kinase